MVTAKAETLCRVGVPCRSPSSDLVESPWLLLSRDSLTEAFIYC